MDHPPNLPEALLKLLSKATLSKCIDGRIQDLSGFRKKDGHQVPVEHTEGADEFVRELGDGIVTEQITALHRSLRQHLAYKRSEMQLTQTRGSILMQTPACEVRAWIEQHPEQADHYRQTLELAKCRPPDAFLHPDFIAAFEGHCNALALSASTPIDIEAEIDRIEENPAMAKALDYPLDASHLRLLPPPGAVELFMDPGTIRFTARSGCTLRELVEQAIALLKAQMGDS